MARILRKPHSTPSRWRSATSSSSVRSTRPVIKKTAGGRRGKPVAGGRAGGWVTDEARCVARARAQAGAAGWVLAPLPAARGRTNDDVDGLDQPHVVRHLRRGKGRLGHPAAGHWGVHKHAGRGAGMAGRRTFTLPTARPGSGHARATVIAMRYETRRNWDTRKAWSLRPSRLQERVSASSPVIAASAPRYPHHSEMSNFPCRSAGTRYGVPALASAAGRARRQEAPPLRPEWTG